MSNIIRFGGKSSLLISHLFKAEVGVSSNFGQTITANSGLVGNKKKAIASSFLVGSNTNNPTLTVTLYGSNDGTNFTLIGSYTLPKNDTSVTKAVSKIQEFDATGYTYFRLTGSGVLAGQTYGYGITLALV